MAGRKRRAARVRPLEVAAGLAAAGLLAAGIWPAAPVQVAAATVAVFTPQAPLRSAVEAPIPLRVEVPPAVPPPLVDSSAATGSGPGMTVPQPPRPARTGRVVNPYVGYGESPELTPRPVSCGGHVSPRRVDPGVVPGVGSATLTWQAGGRAEVLGYRVSAVSQTLVPGVQPAPVQRTVAQPADCSPVEVTVPGLTPGDSYVFWLEEQTLDPTTEVVSFVQVGTSEAVVIS